MLKDLIEIARPHQWVKNSLLFASLVFSQSFTNVFMVERAVLGFILFCALSSAVYIINDITDRGADRVHPEKRNRPLAAGRLSVSVALVLASFFLAFSLLGSFWLRTSFGYCALGYLGLNLAYSFLLKHVVIIDVMAVALGFVLRAVAGAYAINVRISSWLIVCTILLALFLAFGKRRHELISLPEKAVEHRRILSQYSVSFLDQMMGVATACTVIAYTFYTLSPEVKAKFGGASLELTIPFVLYGIFRYQYLIYQKDSGGNPTKSLLSDLPILINIFLWLAAFVALVLLR